MSFETPVSGWSLLRGSLSKSQKRARFYTKNPQRPSEKTLVTVLRLSARLSVARSLPPAAGGYAAPLHEGRRKPVIAEAPIGQIPPYLSVTPGPGSPARARFLPIDEIAMGCAGAQAGTVRCRIQTEP
jgi:hypothetical protein